MRHEEARKGNKAYNLTFHYLRQYKNMIRCVETGAVEAADAGNEFTQLQEASKALTAAIVENMRQCLDELKAEQAQKGQPEKYEVLEMYFFQEMTYEQILKKTTLGSSTPRRWVSEMVENLAVKLFGAAAIGGQIDPMKKT